MISSKSKYANSPHIYFSLVKNYSFFIDHRSQLSLDFWSHWLCGTCGRTHGKDSQVLFHVLLVFLRTKAHFSFSCGSFWCWDPDGIMQRLAGHLLAASCSGLEARDLIAGHMHFPGHFSTCPMGTTTLQIHSPAYHTVQAQNHKKHMEAPRVLTEAL